MKPIMQTKFGLPDGNCVAACLFSLLELDRPLEDAPDFMREEHWVFAVNRWLRQERIPWRLLCIFPADDVMEILIGCTIIASGPGPRGIDHAVLWRDGKLVHDPHPEGGGISKINDIAFLVAESGASSDFKVEIKYRSDEINGIPVGEHNFSSFGLSFRDFLLKLGRVDCCELPSGAIRLEIQNDYD